MHQVDIGRSPRDLDIYVDVHDVEAIHRALQRYSTDTPAFSRTPIYASILSHYQIDGHPVEVVGDFKVQALESSYQVEAAYLWERHSGHTEIGGQELRVMPLAHELVFNILRNRPDRYEAIYRTMRQYPEQHMQALHDLLERNSWGTPFRRELDRLIDSL